MKRLISFTAAVRTLAAMMLVLAVSALSAQNMNRYVTLTVSNGAVIYLSFNASTTDPVKVVSGSNSKTFTSSAYLEEFTAGATTLTVYGNITRFGCNNNKYKVTAVDLSHNTQLERFTCDNTGITTLNVTNNTALTLISCSATRISTLDLSKNTALESLYIDSCVNMTVLPNLSKNTKLKLLSCSYNQWKSLDVSMYPTLETLYCGNSRITSLDVSKCTNLKVLSCASTYLHSLDVSKNTKLTELNCGNNQNGSSYSYLGTLDVSKNTELTNLNCCYNNLTSLDVSRCTKLQVLNCSGNKLASLDLGRNTELTFLDCSSNHTLTSLLVQTNTKLKILNCYFCGITSQYMDYLICSLPERSSSDGAVFCPLQRNSTTAEVNEFMKCNANNAKVKNWKVQKYLTNGEEITTNGTFRCEDVNVDMSQCIKLTANGAIKMAVGAGANSLYRIVCGKTDTLVKKYSGSWNFSGLKPTDTAYLYGNITSFTLEAVTSGSDTGSVRYLDANGNSVLKGLAINGGLNVLKVDKCPLTILNCMNTRLSSLDLSKNTDIMLLQVNGNKRLTSLDLSNDTALTFLLCDSNVVMKSLLLNCPKLTMMTCVNNQLSTLDLSGCPMLEQLICKKNVLKSLILGSGMKALDCSMNYLTSLDVSNSPNLMTLDCSNNSFSTEAWDVLMCNLPELDTNGAFFPLAVSENGQKFKAANAKNARDKKWVVCYSGTNDSSIVTTGTFDCATLPVREAVAESVLRVWPNPARTELHFSGVSGENVIVYDLTGRVMYRTDHAGKDEIVVNVVDWAKGMYFVRAGRSTVKFVKE